MTHLINRILSKLFGIRIKRTKFRKINRNKIDRPILVEFVGASGVGKTTLYKSIFPQIKNEWLHISEFSQLITNPTHLECMESLSCYEEIAKHKVESILSLDYTGLDQMNLIKYFHSVLIEDSVVHLFNKNYNVIAEDGLFHNFSESILALSKSNEEEFKRLIKNRAIIYCYTSAEIVAKRILKREKNTGQIRPQHKLFSYDELVDRQKISLDFKHLLIEFLSDYNIPILSIDTSKPMIENINQVKQFLNELTQRK